MYKNVNIFLKRFEFEQVSVCHRKGALSFYFFTLDSVHGVSRGIKLSKIKVLSFIKSVWLAFDLLTFLLSLPVEPTAFRCSAHFDLWELPCDWPQRQMPSGPFCTWSYRKKCHFSSTSDLIRDRLTKSLNQNWQWAFFQFSRTRTRTHTHAHTLSHAYVTKSIPGK